MLRPEAFAAQSARPYRRGDRVLIGDVVRAGILVEVTGGSRHRVFAFKAYLDILHDAIGDLSGVVGTTDPLVTEAPDP